MPDVSRPLRRSRTNRHIAGVLGGLAEYFRMDPTLLRVIYLVGSIVSAAFPGILVYVRSGCSFPTPTDDEGPVAYTSTRPPPHPTGPAYLPHQPLDASCNRTDALPIVLIHTVTRTNRGIAGIVSVSLLWGAESGSSVWSTQCERRHTWRPATSKSPARTRTPCSRSSSTAATGWPPWYELEERQAAERLRRVRDRVPGRRTATRFFPLNNRLAFRGRRRRRSIRSDCRRCVSPIQKFRWVHFPRNADLDGAFTYRVTPVFMDDEDKLSQGEPQEADIELRRETYPGPAQRHLHARLRLLAGLRRPLRQDRRDQDAAAGDREGGLDVQADPSQDRRGPRLDGLRGARDASSTVLDQAIKDKAEVRVVAYDLSEPEVVGRLEKLGPAAEDHHRRQQGARRAPAPAKRRRPSGSGRPPARRT